MPERFLRKSEIGAVFGTSPDIARAILWQHGVHPVDLGVGRGRGLRWLESAVQAVVQKMHMDACPKPKNHAGHAKAGPAPGTAPLADMSVDELSELLTSGQSVQ